MRTIDDVTLRSNDRQAIELAARALREQFPVEEIILFGSKARGTDDEESDFDLLVLTSREISWRESDTITTALYPIQLDCEVAISTLILSKTEWTEGPYFVLPIYDEIKRDGTAVC
ncbi:MAG: nucleotidyltransferase domain-containing protein [bacterium]